MISETILEKLKPSNSYIVKPTEKTLTKLTKSQNSLKRYDKDEKHSDDLVKFKETLLSINASQKSEINSSREPKYGKRVLLKSLKGGPLIPLPKNGTNRHETPPLISQSLPQLKLKTLGNLQQRQISSITEKNQTLSKSLLNNPQMIQETEQSLQSDNRSMLYKKEPQQVLQKKQQQENMNEQIVDQQEQESEMAQNKVKPIQQVQEEHQEEEQQSQNISEQEHIQCLVEQHLSEQEEFVKHLAGKCICVQCPCGRCKCKFQYKPFATNLCWNSNYRSSYKENPIKEQDLKVDLEQFKKFKSVESCEYKTTMGSDFKSYQIIPPEQKVSKTYKPSLGTTPMTSYKNFYMNYGDLHYEQFKQSHYKTVIPELPFNPNTTYKQSFKIQQLQDNAYTKPPNGKPFPTIDLFLGQSQNKQAYQPKQVEKAKAIDQHGEIMQVPAYQGQYTSVTHNDYVKKEILCEKYK
ncbi:unnamed protein product [Paramecium pentaurelia]|uniref:STOP protein n=1 Tax=Paramecium pentaurelia TaxID=43138 RepID=A0A8S1S614_9CILI|nr:unnamed protein product [Paramecium pentaurelia]